MLSLLRLCSVILFFSLTGARGPKQTIIDDSSPIITYSTPAAWNVHNASLSSSGLAQPDPQRVYNGTWHDITYRPGDPPRNLSFTFNGTGLAVYCILVDLAYSIFPQPANVRLSGTFLTFTVDNQSAGNFLAPWKYTTTTSYGYNQTVFQNLSLPDGSHNFTMNLDYDSVVLFDYAVVYHGPPQNGTDVTTHQTSYAALIGGVVGGVVFVLFAAAGAFVIFRPNSSTLRDNAFEMTPLGRNRHSLPPQPEPYILPPLTSHDTGPGPPGPSRNVSKASLQQLQPPITTYVPLGSIPAPAPAPINPQPTVEVEVDAEDVGLPVRLPPPYKQRYRKK